MIFACPAVASLAGTPGLPIIVDQPPLPITVITLLSDRVDTSYSPPADMAGYRFRYATSPGLAWASMTDVDPLGIRAAGYVLLTELPAAAVEVAVRPQDLAGQEGAPEARQLLGAAPPVGIPLAPDYTVAWALQKTDAGAGVNAQTGASTFAELHGGTAATGVTDRAAALWTLAQSTPPFKFSVTYNPGVDAPSPTPGGGIFFQIMFARALGADPNVSHLPAGTTPRDATYSPLLNGVRASIDTDAAAGGGGSDQVRLRAYTGGVVSGDLAVVGGQRSVPFPRDQDSLVEVSVPGDDSFSVKATFQDGSSVTQGFQDAAIATYLGTGAVNIGLLAWSGRDAKLSGASVAPIVVTPPGGNEGLAPPFPQPATSANVILADAGNFTTKYSFINPGDTILVAPGFSYGSNLALGRSGGLGSSTDGKRPDKPIVIRVGTLAADGKTIVDPPSFPAATFGGFLTVTGNYNWIRGFKIAGFEFGTTTGNRLNRCLVTKNSGDASTDSSLDWCEWTNMPGIFHEPRPRDGWLRPFIYRCYFHHDVGTVAPSRVFLSGGNGIHDFSKSVKGYIRDCLFSDNVGGVNGVQQACEAKSSDSIYERCAAVRGGGALRFNARAGQRNRYLALWTDDGDVNTRGTDHLIADCVVGSTNGCGPAAGDMTYAAWIALADRSGVYPIGENVRVVRVDSPQIGDSDAGNAIPPINTSTWGCAPPLRFKNGASVAPADIHSAAPADVPARTDSGAKKWNPSEVGPNAAWAPGDSDDYWYRFWKTM